MLVERDAGPALFELTLHGGGPERAYRRQRPRLETLPWGSLAPPVEGETRLAASRSWTEAALEEYAGAAQHAALLRLLVKAGAPLDLSALVSRMTLDELAHAEICARMATELGAGVALAYQPDRVFPALSEEGDPELTAAALAVHGCCVFEAFAHAQLLEQQAQPQCGLRREVFTLLARDEAAHARLGFLYLDWLFDDLCDSKRDWLRERTREAMATLRRGIAQIVRLPELHFIPGAPLAGFDAASYTAFTDRVLRERIEPPLAARGLL